MTKRMIWILAAAACLAGSASLARPQAKRSHSTQSTRKAAMSLSYHRTGGFAGFNDEVKVDGDTLTVSRRGQQTFQRKLTGEEQKELSALAAEAKRTKFEKAPPHRPVPDAFNTSVSVDGQTVQIDAPPEKMPAAWQKLSDRLAKFVNETAVK